MFRRRKLFRKQSNCLAYSEYLENISRELNHKMLSQQELDYEDFQYIQTLDDDMRIWALRDYLYYIKNFQVVCDDCRTLSYEVESVCKKDIAKLQSIFKNFGFKLTNWIYDEYDTLILSAW
jgi:hypothetical protein